MIQLRHAGEYVSTPRLSTLYVGFNLSRPPFRDARVRRAFALVIDREALADVELGGYASPATGGFIPPGMPGHSPGIGLPYDPEKARQLLAEAGYPGGRGFPVVDFLTFPGYPGNEYLQAQWQENLGVEIRLEAMEHEAYYDKLDREMLCIFYNMWWADYPDPDNFLRVCLTWVRRRTRWRNEAYEDLVEEARRVTDQGERMKLYGQADRILVEEAAVLPLTYGRIHELVKPWVSRFPLSPMGYTLKKVSSSSRTEPANDE